MFDNQIEALKLTKGDCLKFVNHRTIWRPGRLQYMIDFLEKMKKIKRLYFFQRSIGVGTNL